MRGDVCEFEHISPLVVDEARLAKIQSGKGKPPHLVQRKHGSFPHLANSRLVGLSSFPFPRVVSSQQTMMGRTTLRIHSSTSPAPYRYGRLETRLVWGVA